MCSIIWGQHFTSIKPMPLKNIFIYLFGRAMSQLQHVGSLVSACEIQFPNQISNPDSLHWEPEVLATGPLGKFQAKAFLFLLFISSCLFQVQGCIYELLAPGREGVGSAQKLFQLIGPFSAVCTITQPCAVTRESLGSGLALFFSYPTSI